MCRHLLPLRREEVVYRSDGADAALHLLIESTCGYPGCVCRLEPMEAEEKR